VPPTDFPFTLPLDLRLHPQYQYETIWYIGVLQTADKSRSFGVEYMLGSQTQQCLDADAVSMPAVAWAALADPRTGVFRQQFLVTNATTNARNASAPFFLETGAWGVRQQKAGEQCPASDRRSTAHPSPTPRLAADWTQQRLSGFGLDDRRLDFFAYDLCFSIEGGGRQHTQAMGQNGLCLIVDPAHPSTPAAVLHMEQTTLVARGQITVDGQSFDVSGTLWYQHMWGSPSSASARSRPLESRAKLSTWDWFFVRLDDGFALQLVRFAAFEASSYLNLVRPDGSNTYFPFDQFTLTAAEPWVSDDGHTYFMRHELTLPAEEMQLSIHTLQNDNVLRIISKSFFYEGASHATGVHRGVNVSGDAFTEHLNG
jgi:predicted secreted hydrolase